jgi:hypothetical protein
MHWPPVVPRRWPNIPPKRNRKDPIAPNLIVRRNVRTVWPVEAAPSCRRRAIVVILSAQRNTLDEAVLDIDGMSKPKKRKFSFETL